MKPRITLITVCYNSKKTIKRTLESVYSQNYSNLEYIIVDGLSTDGTVDIINNFIKDKGMSVKFISEKDSGIYDAMNKGINLSTGDLICMLNSDDWLELGVLDEIAKSYSGDDFCVFYGMERRIKNGQENQVGFISHNFIKEGNIPHQTCYVPKKCYEKFGLYDVSYKSAGDYDFLLRLYFSGEVRFEPIYKILVNFTVGGMSANKIGYEEEAKIKYKYKIIDRKKYIYLRFRAEILNLIGQLN